VLVTTAPEASLLFNYRTHFNEVWDAEALKRDFHYDAVYPAEGATGLAVNLK
jgi:hypothetical protein